MQKNSDNNLNKWLIGLLLASGIAGSGFSYSHVYLFHLVLLPAIIHHSSNLKLYPYRTIHCQSRYLLLSLGSISAFYVWSIISLFWAINQTAGILHLMQLSLSLAALLIAVFCAKNVNDFKFTLKIISAVLIFEALIGMSEIFTGFRWPISAYSSNAKIFGYESIYLSKVEGWLQSVSTRPTGLQWNTNNYAVVAGVASIFYFVLAGNTGKLIALFIGSLIVICTEAKSIFIIYSLIFIIFFMKGAINYPYKIILSTLLVCQVIVGGYLLFSPSSDGVGRYLRGSENIIYDPDPKKKSINIRKSLYVNSIKGGFDNALLGVGAGGSRTYHKKTLDMNKVVRTHNYPLEIMLELGVIGLLLFVFFISIVGMWGYNVYKTTRDISEKKIQMAFLATFPLVMFSMVTISTNVYFLPFWIYLGLFLCISRIISLPENNHASDT